ncbi:hypothetical protein IG631_07607 [Alternaria alternata]|nr:hypothetical protein IG631_07607 [Alternaria alternata]
MRGPSQRTWPARWGDGGEQVNHRDLFQRLRRLRKRRQNQGSPLKDDSSRPAYSPAAAMHRGCSLALLTG